MSKPSKETTRVISFRLPAEIAKKIDREAKRQKTVRSRFVEGLFIPAFERHVEQAKAA